MAGPDWPCLLHHLDHLPDARRRGSRPPLSYVLALAACAVLAGARSLTEIAERPADTPAGLFTRPGARLLGFPPAVPGTVRGEPHVCEVRTVAQCVARPTPLSSIDMMKSSIMVEVEVSIRRDSRAGSIWLWSSILTVRVLASA
ncbi:transposase family protein [Streptomyces sp. N2A]|uniref:transposase family protein n=1 Tax=Streptomyces sp. N2A TaxID=3073936 RepID=UPI0037D99C41